MMQNSYTSSIISMRTYFCINEHSYYSYEKCPSSCCSCCCSFSLNSSRFTLPLNPSLLYGSRQSALISWAPPRRLMFGAGDWYCGRSLVYDVGRCHFVEPCCVKEGRGDRVLESCGGKCDGQGKNVDKINVRGRMSRHDYGCNALGDAEAMLSLLAEDSIVECLDVRERRGASKLGKVVRKDNVVSEKFEDRWNGKEDVGSLYLEHETMMFRVDSGRSDLRDEGRKRRGEMEGVANEEGWRSRRRESSSSYYSLSDSGEFESDTEVEVERERVDEEHLSGIQKELRKVGGIVISEENNKNLKRDRDERNQELRIGSHDNTKVGSSAEWDCRKKSEKKLVEESAEVTKSKDSVVRQSLLSQIHESSSAKAASSSKNQFNYKEKQSTSTVTLGGQSRSQVKTYNRTSEHSISGTRHEQLTQTNRNNAATSTWTSSNDGKGGIIVAGEAVRETKCDYCKSCGSVMPQMKTQTDFQQHAELSESHGNATWTEAGLGQFESRFRKQEKGSTSHQNSVEEGAKQHEQMIFLAAGQVNIGSNFQHQSGTVDSHDSYVESLLRSQQQIESRQKNLEENSSSVILRKEVKELQEQSGDKVIEDTESSGVSQTGLGTSQVHSTNVHIGSQFSSEQRIYDAQTFSSSMLKSVEEVVEKHKQIEETIMQSAVSTEVHDQIMQASSAGNSSGGAIVPQPPVTVISQTGVQQLEEGQGNDNLTISCACPSFQFIETSSYGGPSSTSTVANDSGKVSVVGTGSAYVHSQLGMASSSGEVKGTGSTSYEDFPHKDMLSSAIRMEESSSQIVGEFVEKMRHETSTSATGMETKSSQLDSNSQDEKHALKRSTQSDSEKSKSQKKGSRRSSRGSGTEGPSDEMWDVKDHFSQEPSEVEPLEGAISEIVVPRRTGKSLWSVVGGIFQLRWGSHSETQNSPVKSGGQNSPTRSGSGETWFSGNEQDDDNSENLKTEQVSLPQGPTSSAQPILQRNVTRSGKEDFGVLSLDDKTKQVLEDTSSSSSVFHLGLLSGRTSAEASTNWNTTKQISLSTPPLDSSVPSARKLRRSHAFEEMKEAGQSGRVARSTREQREQIINVTKQKPPSTPLGLSVLPARGSIRSHTSEEIEEAGLSEGVVSSTRGQREHAINAGQTDATSSEVTDAELKRKKLQRSKQVLEERFNQWEDAYKRENEQRKVDEIFMREALVEAKKAADSWEVPVGAVLVHNGKIIARGFNLVEELRDSTAHAEMICIREASNALKTWRLSETILYVTLEPCPMCAGAILQARIGTLVWGAPNKLLGADGSWIRLFSEGTEGEKRLDMTDKPAPPVHPFHPKMKIRRGLLEAECADMMQQFFQLRRKKEKKSEEPDQPSCLPVPHHPSKLLHKMHGVFHFMFCL